MRPTAWEHQSLDRWHDDTKERDRPHRRREAAQEIAAQLRDAEPAPVTAPPWGWDDGHGWTTHESDVAAGAQQ